jgi:hypothetical protein
LFVLHDFDFDGFKIFGTLQRDTRRYQFSNEIEVIDPRLEDIEGLERELAAATKMSEAARRAQLAENGANDSEIAILLNERVELNAMTSDALIEMIERKLQDYGLEKVIPDDDLLAETYRAHSISPIHTICSFGWLCDWTWTPAPMVHHTIIPWSPQRTRRLTFSLSCSSGKAANVPKPFSVGITSSQIRHRCFPALATGNSSAHHL